MNNKASTAKFLDIAAREYPDFWRTMTMAMIEDSNDEDIKEKSVIISERVNDQSRIMAKPVDDRFEYDTEKLFWENGEKYLSYLLGSNFIWLNKDKEMNKNHDFIFSKNKKTVNAKTYKGGKRLILRKYDVDKKNLADFFVVLLYLASHTFEVLGFISKEDVITNLGKVESFDGEDCYTISPKYFRPLDELIDILNFDVFPTYDSADSVYESSVAWLKKQKDEGKKIISSNLMNDYLREQKLLPLSIDSEGKRMSKRISDANIQKLIDKGIIKHLKIDDPKIKNRKLTKHTKMYEIC
jgi:hypothetical protein